MKLIIILSLISVCLSEECVKLPVSKLVLVTGMFRHGERTPDPDEMKMFPEYGFKEDPFKPFGPGQLTHQGKCTMFNLGEKLRHLYARKLFGKRYLTRDDILMESTGYRRSLISAQIVLEGLLGDNSIKNAVRTRWRDYPHLNETLNAEKERYYESYYNEECPLYFTKFQENLKKSQEHLTDCKRPMEEMKKYLGVKNPNPLLVWFMSELYKAHVLAGKEFPYPFTTPLLEQMDNCIYELLYTAFETDELKRLSGGVYVATMLNEFKKYIDGTDRQPNKKLRLFSGHYTTIAPAVAALGGPHGYTKHGNNFTVDQPSYGSVILTELHQETKTQKYFIKIYYWNESKNRPTLLRVQGCETPDKPRCYLEDYKKLVKNIRISKKQLDGLCQKTKKPNGKL